MRATLVLPIAFALSACAAGANLGPGAAERLTQTAAVPAPPAEAFAEAARLAAEWGWTVRSSDADTGVLQAQTPQTMGRWADDVSVIVSAGADDGSEVTVRSGLANGPNVSYVRGYLDALAARLGGSNNGG